MIDCDKRMAREQKVFDKLDRKEDAYRASIERATERFLVLLHLEMRRAEQ